jgi:hypothetical protein
MQDTANGVIVAKKTIKNSPLCSQKKGPFTTQRQLPPPSSKPASYIGGNKIEKRRLRVIVQDHDDDSEHQGGNVAHPSADESEHS